MNDGTLFVLAGLALQAAGVFIAIAASNRKQGERFAVVETKMQFALDAINDIKKGAGLNRRCSDCEKRVDAGE